MHSLRRSFFQPSVVDLSEQAARLGFAFPVAISRVAYEQIIFRRAPCACSECEEGARNLLADRIERLLLSLGEVVKGLDDDVSAVYFTLDNRISRHRRIWHLLRAELGPASFKDPVITITLADEVHEQPLTDLGGSIRPEASSV